MGKKEVIFVIALIKFVLWVRFRDMSSKERIPLGKHQNLPTGFYVKEFTLLLIGLLANMNGSKM